MALITCPECGKEVSSLAKNCIHCGYPLQNLTQQATQTNEVSPIPQTETQQQNPPQQVVAQNPALPLKDLNKQFQKETRSSLGKTVNVFGHIDFILPIVVLVLLLFKFEDITSLLPLLNLLIFAIFIVGITSTILTFAYKMNDSKRFDSWMKNNQLNIISTYKASILTFIDETAIADDNLCFLQYLSLNPQDMGKYKATKVLGFIGRLLTSIITPCIYLYALFLANVVTSISALVPLIIPCVVAYIPSATLFIIGICLNFSLEKRAKNWYTQQIQNV